MWTHRTMGALATAAALIAAGHPATQGVVAARQSGAAGVMQEARRAIGDRRLNSLTSLQVEATAVRNIGEHQATSTVELLLELPDKYMRSETSTGGVVNIASTVGFNGDRPLKAATGDGPGAGGLMIRIGPGPMGGPPRDDSPPLSREEQQEKDRAMVRSAQQELSRLMLAWFATALPSANPEYSDAGLAESPDGKARVIDVKDANGLAARLFLDEQTHLPLMLTYQAPLPRMVTMAMRGDKPAPGGPPRRAIEQRAGSTSEPPSMGEYALYFDDWREVDGIRFPHRMRRAVGGVTSEEWTIGKVRVNPKMDPKRFEVAP